MRNELRRVAVREALENERRARTVGMGPIAAAFLWVAISWGISKLLDRLWDWWWDEENQPRAAGGNSR